MSNKILNRVWKDKTVKSSRDRLALLSLADQANDDGICWPGLRSIEKRMNCSKPTAAKAINRLEHLGAIAVFESHGKFGRRSNHYIVKVGMDEQEYDAALAAMDDKIGISEARKPENYETPELPELIKNKESQGKPILTDLVNPSLPCQGKPILTDLVNPSLPDPIVNPHSFNPNGNHSVPNGTVSAPPPPKSANGKSKPQDALGEDALNKSSVAAPVAVEAEMLKAWGKLFPNKRQPRPGTHLSEIRTLLKKTPDFGDVWLAAMSAAAESKACQAEGWFQFAFFVKPTKGNKPDLNYRRCLDRFMAWKDKDYRQKMEPARFATVEDVEAEFARMNGHLPPLG